MRTFVSVLATVASLASASDAAVFQLVGGTPADFSPGYFPADLTIGEAVIPDPWPDPGALAGAGVLVDPNHRINVYLRGGTTENAWSADFGGVANAFGAESSPGDSVLGLSVSDFLAFWVSNEGSGAGFGDPRLVVQVVEGALEFGWDGWSEGIIGEYGRFYAVPAPIPVPASLPLLAAGIFAFAAFGRRSPTRN